MTKAEIIDAVAAGAKISKAASAKAVDSFTGAISKSLKKGKKVTLVGFGTFSVTKRKARKGRNPRTGEPIKIAASKSPKFSAGKALKQAIK
jgi:DNA-binding protein HU-beta